MGAQVHAAVQPAQLVRAPASTSLYARLSVDNVARSLVSLLPGGVLPTLTVPNISGPAGTTYAIKGVVLGSETDPSTAKIRITADGQTAPTATLGSLVPVEPSERRIMCDPQDIQIIGSVAGPTFVQCYLIIGGM